MGRSFLLRSLGLLLLPSFSAGQSAPRQQVLDLLQTHRFAEAELAARSALRSAPTDCSLQTMLGLALRGENKLDEAYDTLRTTSRVCAASLPAFEGAAEIAYQQHRPEARELLEKILDVKPDDPTAHAMLGALDAAAGDCGGAVDHYAKSGPQLKGNSQAQRQDAGCLMALGRAVEAVTLLEELLAAEPSPENRLMLGRAELAAGQHADTLSTLAPLVTSDSHDDRALLLAAQAAEADNQTPRAIAWLRQAMEAAPRRVENYLYFAEISFSHGSYGVGVDFVNLGLKQIPGNARLLLARGVLEVQLGTLDGALADFEEAHRLDPKLSLAEDAMGVLFSQRHDMAAALTVFEQKVRQAPTDALLQYLYAEALAEDPASSGGERLATAIEAARRSVSLEPSYQPARDLLCVLLLRQGDFAGVVVQAEEALRHDAFDETALFQEVRAESKLKHAERAEELVKRLQAARAHNQTAVTKYMLNEPGSRPGVKQ